MLADARSVDHDPTPATHRPVFVATDEKPGTFVRPAARTLLPLRNSIAPIDLQEREDSYVVYVTLEQCAADEVSLHLKDGMLKIGHHDRATLTDSDRRQCAGFSIGFFLPSDAEDWIAGHTRQDGMLIVVIPKRDH